MKNFKGVLVGFLAGTLCSGAVAVAASPTIQAYLMNDAKIYLDGNATTVPDDQGILNYNNRIYVPLRFISEQMGSDVTWESTTNSCLIKTNPKIVTKTVEKEVEKIVYVEKSAENSTTKVYSKLPITYQTNNYTVKVTGITRNDYNHSTKVFISVTNDEDNQNDIELRNRYATLTVDGKAYALNLFVDQDSKFANSIAPGETVDGYICFDEVPETFTNCDLTLILRTNTANTSSDTSKTYYFRVEN